MSTSQKSPYELNFLPPRLVEGTRWYIIYYVYCPSIRKLKRVRIGLGYIKSKKERKALSRKIMQDLSIKLSAGWNPFTMEEQSRVYKTFEDVLEIYISIQAKEAETHSFRSYKSYVNFFKQYLIANGFGTDMFVNHFDKNAASTMMLKIRQNPKYSFRTYNNYLQFFTSLFNWFIQFNYIDFNPFTTIKKAPKKLIQKQRETLSHEQRGQLARFLEKENNNNYFVMCLMCYYCFIRPNEISLLRVKDVDIVNQTIFISKEIAKNDTDSIRTIPDAMMPYINKLALSSPSEYFLFSNDIPKKFVPGKKRAEGREIARYWSDVIRPGLNWPKSLQFYSLKDTGITNMLTDGVAPNFVQGQADHSSLSITSIYAQKRNAEAQEEIKEKARSF